MKILLRLLLACSLVAPLSAAVQLPASSRTNVVLPDNNLWTTTALLSAGDAAQNGYRMVGIPDGLGAYDNNDGTFTVLMNHELGNTSGAVRAHGSNGAFVSKWVIRKDTLAIVSGADLIQRVKSFDKGTASWRNATLTELNFGRFCSADLAAPTAFFNAATGLGTTTRIFMNGEETGSEGRAMAHIVTGTDAGTSYELPHLGRASWENLVANPLAQNKTIVIGDDDSTPGYVFVYVGTKRSTGNDIEKAGLVGGSLYGIRSADMTTEPNTAFTKSQRQQAFTLVNLGDVSQSTGAQIRTAAAAGGVTLFNRPEDGAWNPSATNEFFFVTTNAFGAASPTRLWRLTFRDIANPETGGILELMWDGSNDGDGSARMFDNITVNRTGQVLLQEDPGNQSYLARIHSFDIAKRTLRSIAAHPAALFTSGNPGFITVDEESSGIIDISPILGTPDTYLLVSQVHATATTANLPAGANATETVELGQLLLLSPSTRHTAISSRGRTLGSDPMIVGFVVGGTEPKTVLVRSLGPSLTAFGVSGALANPSVRLYRADGQAIAENNDWKVNANVAAVTATGMAPLNANEAAILITLDPGAYTAIVRDESGVGGNALLDVYEYELQPGQTSARLVSLSARANVGPADGVLIAGFLVEGRESRKVLIRSAGPSLSSAGVTGALQDTRLSVYKSSTLLATNDDWSQNAAAVAQFTLTPGLQPTSSVESALVLTLDPGTYTVILEGVNNGTGTALVSVTEL